MANKTKKNKQNSIRFELLLGGVCMAMENLCKCLLTNHKIPNKTPSIDAFKFCGCMAYVLNARSSKCSSMLSTFAEQNLL